MPPKKAKAAKGAKGAKSKTAVVIDGVDTTEMTRERLEQFTMKVKEELDREREERNYFQLERDKIRTFWEITRAQLEEAKADLRNRERATEESEEQNEALLETEKQRIKHLEYEHQVSIASLRAENLVALKAAKEEHEEQEAELLRDKRELKTQIRENNLKAQNEMRQAKLIHQEDIHNARVAYEEKAKEIELKAEHRLQTMKTELTIQHRTEMSEVEERKNKQLAELIEEHESAYAELKNYYNDITLNNLGLISSLKQQMEEMQQHKERAETQAAEAQAEVRRLKEPLERALAEMQEMKRQMQNYERDKSLLASKTRALDVALRERTALSWEREALEARRARAAQERDELRAKFAEGVLGAQRTAAMRTASLEARLKQLEGRDLPATELTELLRDRESQISSLRYETARLRKAHDDLLATYEAKLARLGVPKAELGFKPLKAVAVAGLTTVIGQGPAGLVTKNK